MNLIRYLFHNSDIMQDRILRNNGIPLLSFLLQRLPKRFIDITKSKKYLNFNPKVSLKEGLQKTISWYKSNHNKISL